MIDVQDPPQSRLPVLLFRPRSFFVEARAWTWPLEPRWQVAGRLHLYHLCRHHLCAFRPFQATERNYVTGCYLHLPQPRAPVAGTHLTNTSTIVSSPQADSPVYPGLPHKSMLQFYRRACAHGITFSLINTVSLFGTQA